MPNVQFVLDADEGKAVQGFLKLMDAQKKVESGTREITKESNKLLDSIVKIGVAFSAGALIHQGLSAVLSMMRQWDQYMDSIAKKINESTKSMMNFALTQDPGTRKERMKEAINLGAKYGVQPEQSVDITQTMSQMPGSNWKKGLDASKYVFQGMQAGIQYEDLRNFVVAGNEKGLEPWKSVYLPFAGGKISSLSPEVMAKSSIALPSWDDPTLMMSAGVNVLAGSNAESYQTYLARAGDVLNRSVEAPGKLWKKLHVEGKPQFAKLEALKNAGIDTIPELEKAGLRETEANKGLQAILGQWDVVKANYKKISGEASPTVVEKEVQSVRQEVPQIGLAMQSQQTQAQTSALDYTTSEGLKAQAIKLQKQEIALKAKEQGGGFLADENMGWYGRLLGGGAFPKTQEDYLMRVWSSGADTDRDRSNLFRSLDARAQKEGVDTQKTIGADNSDYAYYKQQFKAPSDEMIEKLIKALADNTKAREQDNKSRSASTHTE